MSLMNGLSALGAGVSQFAGTAGIEAQKSALQQQAMTLADQLATTRETALQQGQQKFQAGESELTRAQQTQMEQARLATTTSEGAANRANAITLEQARLNATPEQIKVLRALGIQLPGDATPGGTALPSPPGSATAPATITGTTSSGLPGPRASLVSPTTPAVTGSTDITDNPIVAKILGLPPPGSEDAVRRALAKGISNNPKFKGNPEAQAAELEKQLAIAQGKFPSDEAQDVISDGVAAYQLSPLDQRAREMAGGPDLMTKVMQKNPTYLEGKYPVVNKTLTDFASGPEGNKVRFLNVGVQHTSVLDQAADALNNNAEGPNILNKLNNYFKDQFGVAAPNTFDALKQIVAPEIKRAISGDTGSVEDRNAFLKTLDNAKSIPQLKAVTAGMRLLMTGQLNGLKKQYDNGTDFAPGSPIAEKFKFENKLFPETIAALTDKSYLASPTPSGVAPGDTAKLPGDTTKLPDPLGIR